MASTRLRVLILFLGHTLTVLMLWVGAFLHDVVTLHSSNATAAAARVASLISVLGIAFIAGNIVFGALARLFESRGIAVRLFSGITMAGFVLVQVAIAARVPLPEPLLWAAYGTLGGLQARVLP